MTPQEKANELFWKMYNQMIGNVDDNLCVISAKSCVRIAIEEILQTNPTIKGDSEDLITMIIQTKAYWYQVQDALNNL